MQNQITFLFVLLSYFSLSLPQTETFRRNSTMPKLLYIFFLDSPANKSLFQFPPVVVQHFFLYSLVFNSSICLNFHSKPITASIHNVFSYKNFDTSVKQNIFTCITEKVGIWLKKLLNEVHNSIEYAWLGLGGRSHGEQLK